MNIAEIERFVDDFNKPHRKHSHKRSWLALGSIIVAFMIGTMLVLPIFDRKSLLSHLQTYSEGDIDKIIPVADEPGENSTLPAYDYWYAPENSFGIQETKTVNWSYFKQLFNDHFYKNARYKLNEQSEWTDGTQYLTLNKTWNESGFWKVDIILDVPVDLYSVNVSFGCDLQVLNYIERDGHEIWLNYTANATETYSVMLNWSDIAQIPNLEISKHRTDGKFWISFKRDNVPAGYYVFDPTFGNQDEDSASYYLASSSKEALLGSLASPATDGTATSITVRIKASTDQPAICVIFDSSKNYLQKTEEKTITDSSYTWYTFNLDAGVEIFSANSYYITVYGGYIDGFTYVSYDADYADSNRYYQDTDDYAVIPNPWNPSTGTTDMVNIYCTYDEGGEPENTAPVQSNPLVWDGTTADINHTGVIIPVVSFNITINDAEGDKMNVTIRTNASGTWKDVNTSENLGNGTYSNNTNISWVNAYSTKYWISFNLTDGTDWDNNTYYFTTAANRTWQQSWTSNFSFSNSTYNLVQQWNSNFSFSNTSNLEQQWTSNFSFSNSTYNLVQQWTSNMSFSNSTYDLTQQWTSNMSFSNTSRSQQQWTSNFSFSNSTYNLERQWTSNFSFSNSTYDLTQQWTSNFSFSNTTNLQQQWTSNFSFSNSTYNLVQQWTSNFSFSNTSQLEQQWNSNFSFSNTSNLEQQWSSNFSFSNSTFSPIQQWTSNFSFSNSTYDLTQQWTSNFSFSNGTIYAWQQTWTSNFSFSNTSEILTQVWTSNFSFSNSTAYWTERPEDGSQLTTELTQLCININDPQGDNMYWEIWQGGNLLENGTPFTYPTHTYTFNNCTTPHSAYWSSDNVPLKMTGDVEFSCSNYTNVSAVDLLNVTTTATVKDYTHHHFLFNITEDPSTITNVDVNWHGYAGAYLGGAKPKWYWDATMYFDTDAPGWYTADSTTLYTTNPPYEEWLNYTLHHDINDWLDDNGILEIAIQNTYAGQPSIVHTDYIEVVVTYRTGGDPNGSYCTSNVSFWNNVTCEQWWTWNTSVYDGTSTTHETYTFQNMPCVLSAYIYPMNQSTGICPCCDAICFSVGGLYGNINATVYRRGEHEPSFYMVENYTNISNGMYCFCIGGHIDGGIYWPVRFNTTYYWYVYAENYYNNSMNVTSGIFYFTTAEDVADCVDAGGSSETVYITWNTQSAVGLMGLAGLVSIPIVFKYLKRKRKEDEL